MKRIEEERARLLTLFDDQGRALRRLVSLLLMPVVLFGVLVFLPFSQQVTSRGHIQVELDSARSRLALASDRIGGIEAVGAIAKALQPRVRLRRELDARNALWREVTRRGTAASDLVRAWAEGSADIDMQEIAGLTAQFPPSQGASDCIWLDDRRWRECFDVAGDDLCIGRGCFIRPDMRVYIDGLPPETLDEALAKRLLGALAAVEDAIREEVPTLLELEGEPVGGWGTFSQSFTPRWLHFVNGVDKHARNARDEIDGLTQEVALLTANLERTDRLIKGIERSGSAFETPLGQLPVGVRELVFLYPTILGVAYLLCLSAFLKMLALRQAFRDLSEKLDESNVTATPAHLGLTMPLWYDPLRSAWLQVGRVVVALVPLLFLVWSYVALRSLASVISDSAARFNQLWYEMFVILALAVSVVMLGRVLMTVAAQRSATGE